VDAGGVCGVVGGEAGVGSGFRLWIAEGGELTTKERREHKERGVGAGREILSQSLPRRVGAKNAKGRWWVG
jgi:hypothetical protein